jgi:hypothetical protein
MLRQPSQQIHAAAAASTHADTFCATSCCAISQTSLCRQAPSNIAVALLQLLLLLLDVRQPLQPLLMIHLP